MGTKKEATKKKLLEATVGLLESIENPNDITVRNIAEAAGVGVGLINYYYESRDQLIQEAVSQKMKSLATIMGNPDEDLSDPLQYLKEMLIALTDIGMKERRMNKFSAEYELLKGNFGICLYLLPILKKIYHGQKFETDLRLIAFQIIVVLQSIYLRQEAFYMLTGINIDIKKERDNLVNLIVDNLIN